MQEFKVVHDNQESYVVRLKGNLLRLMKSPKLINITNGTVFYAEYVTIKAATGKQLEVIELLSGHTLDQLPIVH